MDSNASNTPKVTIDLPAFDVQRVMQREKLLAGVAAALLSLVAIVVVGFQILPRTFEARERVAKMQKEVAATTQRAAIISNISNEDKENYLRVAQALPQTKEPLVVLQALENISTEANIVVGAFDTSPGLISTAAAVANRASTSKSSAQSMTLTVEINGTFQEINRGLELLETTSPVMEVTELSLSPAERSEGVSVAARYTATLEITTYYFPPQPTNAGRTALPLTPTQKLTLDEILTWRNRLPEMLNSPEAYSRTNLFILEGLGGLFLPTQIEPSDPAQDASSSGEPLGAGETVPDEDVSAPPAAEEPALQQIPVAPQDAEDDAE